MPKPNFKQSNPPKTTTTTTGGTTPAEQAHALGLTYGGFAGWVDKNRKVVAKTVDGKLVRTDDAGESEKQDLGKINIFRFDPNIINMSKDSPSSRFVWKYNAILKAITQTGAASVMLVPRGTEHDVASYLRSIGVNGGIKLATIDADDPNKVREFVSDKIKSGHTNVNYFDTNEHGISAVDSLHAQFNKLDNLHLKTHQLTAKNKPQS